MTRDEFNALVLPDSPGVYFFKKGKRVLYIGKAGSLRDRVRSYFSTDLGAGRGMRIVTMVAEADTIDWKETASVLEALILEANLIKEYQPPYNVDEKDNKSFNYLVITKEGFPRVLIVRGRELFLTWNKRDIAYICGPFPHGGALKEAVKIVRKIFPFRDTCTPGAKLCFNGQIGLCPGVCAGDVSATEYARTIRYIKELFSGNFHGLKRLLTTEMNRASAAERFEEAHTLKRQIAALEHVRDIALIKHEYRISSGGRATGNNRVEAYDVAHTSGTETVAVMVVVENGEVMRSEYRKFTIMNATNDDVASLAEALSRRIAHTEWRLPSVIVVDGGLAQVRVAEKILRDARMAIPVVGVVKNTRHKPDHLVGNSGFAKTHEHDIILANAEAHRFAIRWHRVRRAKRSLRT